MRKGPSNEGPKWGWFWVNVTPSKSEVSELCAATGPKHVDRHHICTGSQGQLNEPQTLQDATKLIIYTYLYLTTLVNTPLLQRQVLMRILQECSRKPDSIVSFSCVLLILKSVFLVAGREPFAFLQEHYLLLWAGVEKFNHTTNV